MTKEKLRMWNVYEGGLHQISGTLSSEHVEIKKIYATNMSGATLYFQIFDTGSAPVLDDVPRKSYGVAANSVLKIEFLEPRIFHTGAAFSWSTGYETLVTGTLRSVSIDIEYRS